MMIKAVKKYPPASINVAFDRVRENCPNNKIEVMKSFRNIIAATIGINAPTSGIRVVERKAVKANPAAKAKTTITPMARCVKVGGKSMNDASLPTNSSFVIAAKP